MQVNTLGTSKSRFGRRSISTATAVLLVLPLLSSCAMNQAERGAVIGGAAGGVLGGVIDDNTTRGAIIGAVVGGTAGALIGREMDQQAAALEEELAQAEVERIGEGIRVTFGSGILFGFDSSELQADAYQSLMDLSRSLAEYPNTDIVITGHTDSTGASSYNQSLSERRADTAAAFLVREGVSRSRMRALGRGEEEPRASNDDEAGRTMNRRVEIAIFASEEYRNELEGSAGP